MSSESPPFMMTNRARAAKTMNPRAIFHIAQSPDQKKGPPRREGHTLAPGISG
jgi:hypothetical protein